MRLIIYITTTVFQSMAMVTLALTGVMWLVQSLKVIEMVIGSDAPMSDLMEITLLALPNSLEIILPVSLVISVIFVYNKLLAENELIIMRACGMNQYRLAAPALILSLLTTIILLFITTYASPMSLKAMAGMKQKIQSAYSGVLLREGVFNSFGNDLTVYIRSRDSSGMFEGVVIYDTRDKKNPPVTTIAKTGDVILTDIGMQFRIHDGIRQQFDPNRASLSKLYFSSYVIDMNAPEKPASIRWKKADERTLGELLYPDPADVHAAESRTHFIAEANDRLVSPFSAFSLILPVLSVLLLGPFNRRGQQRKVLLAIMLVVLQEGCQLSLVNSAKTHLSLLLPLYLLVFVPIIAGLYFLSEKGEARITRAIRALPRLSGNGSALSSA